MVKNFVIDTGIITPIYEQIKNSITMAIEQEKLRTGDRVPSIHAWRREHGVSAGTVIKAYEELGQLGILESRMGKGYFVLSDQIKNKLHVFVLFDRINAYKETLYESLIEHLGDKAETRVFFHHYDLQRFEALIGDSLGKYSHYVVMPHFNTSVAKILKQIPQVKLLVIDKEVKGLHDDYASVCQNFEQDIYFGLQSGIERIKGYEKINLVKSPSRFQFIPEGTIKGFKRFADENAIPRGIIENIRQHPIRRGEIYIVFPDNDLVYLIKQAREKGWVPGKDIGIIAFDDSAVKEVLEGGITTLSTDFEAMGEIAAMMILSGKREKVYNTFRLIERNTL